MIRFNDILRLEDIDPRQVRLSRHKDNRVRNPSLYEVWRSEPELLEKYQAIQFVSTTRWWPPFCLVVDWVVAAIIAVEIVAGVPFHN